MHTFPCIFTLLQSYNSSAPLLYEDSHPDSTHFQRDCPRSHPDSPHSHPDSSYSHPDSPHYHHSPHSVPRFPILAFTDSQSLK